MATGTIPMRSTLIVHQVQILANGSKTLTFSNDVRGEIHFTGTSGTSVRGIISFAYGNSSNVGTTVLFAASAITVTASGNTLTLASTANCNAFVMMFAGTLQSVT